MDWSIISARLEELLRQLLELLPQITVALVVIIITWAVAKFASKSIVRLIAKSKMRRSLQSLFSKLISFLIWAVGLMIAMTIAFPGITPGKLFTVLGISSVAIGFAFKEVFENFMAGIVILVRDVIEIGDVISHDGVIGRVESINIRDTHIRTLDGKRLILPNARLFRDSVEILTDGKCRRVTIMCGVDYDADLDEARSVLESALSGAETVRQDFPREVFAREFGASSVDFEVTWWTGSKPLEVRASRDEVVRNVHRALGAAGIGIPFPQRTLRFPEPLELARSSHETDSRLQETRNGRTAS